MPDDIHVITAKPMAYSYLRFSTPEQRKGDSSRRQTELSRQYALQHDLQLDEALTFHDLGVSAYKGKNATEGKLGAFLKAVDDGLVRPGSYLLVESLDRLSRQQLMPALGQFKDILERDIIVVTLTDSHRYTRDSLNNPTELIMSLMVMARAHEESATKAKRVAQAWSNKRKRAVEDGHKLTATCPAWLTLSEDRKTFEVDRKRAKVVRRIFDLLLNGHGKARIASMFNAEGVPTFSKSKGWHDSYIARISRNGAVIGTFQPKKRGKDEETGRTLHIPDGPPIEGYYPTIVDRAVFLRVKAAQQKGNTRSGRRGKSYSNLFTGVAFCSSCGSAMRLVNKGAGRGEADKYYACSGALLNHSDCKRTLWRYPELEYGILMCMQGIQYTDVFPKLHQKRAHQVHQWQDQRLELEDDLLKTKGRIETAMDLLLDTPSASLQSRLMELEDHKVELEAQLQDIETQLTTYHHQASGIGSDELNENVEAMIKWFEIREEGGEEEQYVIRARMNALLKQQDVKVFFELDGRESDAFPEKVHGRIAIRVGGHETVKLAVMHTQKVGYSNLLGEGDSDDEHFLPVPLSPEAADIEEVKMADRVLIDFALEREGLTLKDLGLPSDAKEAEDA